MANNKQNLLAYLQKRRMIVVATHSARDVNVCTMYYGIDDNFNLYFLSAPTTIHCRNIAKNKKIAAVIVDSEQVVTDKKVGLQLKGTGSLVKNKKELQKGLDAWTKHNKGFENIINMEAIEKNKIESKVWKITLKEIKWFNEEIYGPEGTEVFKFR